MQQAAPWTAATARHNSPPIRATSARGKRRPVAERLFERPALDELHPQADAAVDALGAVDRDDVRMADAGEETAFFDDR